jgi:hypothetical protein
MLSLFKIMINNVFQMSHIFVPSVEIVEITFGSFFQCTVLSLVASVAKLP